MPNFSLTDTISGLKCIVGHVGKEPQMSNTQSGKRVTRFTVATNRKDKDGNVTTDWHTVNCWEERADEAMSVHKGQVVCVVGKESQREYNGKTYTDISAWFVGVGLGAKVPNRGSQPSPPTSGGSQEPPATNDPGNEIPF